MADFFAELKRRHIYRVGAAYVVAAWVLTQVIEILTQVFTLPLWLAQGAIVLLAVGFPVALIAAWVIESRPHVTVAEAVRSKPTVVDWTLCGALAFVLLFMGYQQIALPSDGTTRQAGIDPAREASLSPGVAVSLAVLPFANVSGDPSQDFFSDGMTDEIITALAKIQSLRIVGRSSAFQFKGQNRDLRSVGQSLAATYLIDGSVRMAGNRVRITAQLIQTDNGVGVWTDSFDRELTDVFAIQEDIAQAIAAALRVPLGLAQGERLVSSRIDDVASYQQYLRARALVRARALQPITEAAALLERVVARDPGYSPAWALLAEAYASIPNFHPAWTRGAVDEARRVVNDSLSRAEAAAQRSLQLDANNAEGNGALGYIQEVRGNLIRAEDLYLRALALDPNNPDYLNYYGQLLAKVGRLKESLAMRQRLQALEPYIPLFINNTAGILWLNGQDDAAIEILRAAPPGTRAFDLARIYAAAGRYAEAADTLLEIPAGVDAPGTVEEAVRLLRGGTNSSSSSPNSVRLARLGFVYVYVGGDPNRVLEFYEENAESGYFSNAAPSRLWHSSYAPVRKTARFKTFARKMGLFDYWRERGWPEFCRPVGADDFECS